MKLLTKLAKKIIEEASHVIEEEVVIMSEQAVVIAATNSERVGEHHELAEKMLTDERKMGHLETNTVLNKLEQPEVVFPIHYQKKIIGVIAVSGTQEKAEVYSLFLKHFTELLIQQVHSAEITCAQWRELEGLLHEIFRKREWGEDMKLKASHLGLHLGRSYTLAILESINEAKHEIPYPPLSKGVLLTKWGSRQYIVLISSCESFSPAAVLAQLNAHFIMHGVSIDKTGVSSCSSDMFTIYQEAASALKYSKKDVVYFQDLSMELILNDLSAITKKKLIDDVKGFHEEELYITFQSYIQNDLSLKETAKVLHIHVNTLHYRLKKLEQITGYSCKNVEHLLLLFLSMKLHEESTYEGDFMKLYS